MVQYSNGLPCALSSYALDQLIEYQTQENKIASVQYLNCFHTFDHPTKSLFDTHRIGKIVCPVAHPTHEFIFENDIISLLLTIAMHLTISS